MQSVSGPYLASSKSKVRRPIGKAQISWTKAIQPGLGYFSIGVSLIGGPDRIRGDGNPINENIIYDFADESVYVMSIELDRYADGTVFSVARAVADIVLDNNSGRFTPGGGSNIDDFIKPNRIVKISLGFKSGTTSEYIQNFIGIIVDAPSLDTKEKTITIHALDFAYLIWDQTAKNTAMFTNVTADTIIQQLLQDQGIGSSLINLDRGVNVIPFAYFEKGDKVSDIITKLCEAEMARFYVDENGIFRFQTRDAWNKPPYDTPVINLTDDYILEEDNPDATTLVNAVEIVGKPRQLQQTQFLYALESAKEIDGGETIEFFVNFNDPIFSIVTPSLLGELSYFRAGYSSDDFDQSANAFVEMVGFEIFSKSIKFQFKNNDPSFKIYLTRLEIWGAPATVINGGEGIQVRLSDDDSVDEFGEQLVSIENDYIQSTDYAKSYAQVILNDRKDVSDYLVVKIAGLPQLQIGDRLTRNGFEYQIVRNKLTLTADDGLVQELTIVKRAVETYFRIGISSIGGADIIGP